MNDYYILEPCPTSSGFEIKLKDGKQFDIPKAEKALEGKANILGSTSVMLTASFMGCSLSIYASGRILVRGIEKKLKHDEARTISSGLMEILESSKAVI